MGTTRKYWKGIDELNETPAFLQNRDQEFPQQVSVEEFLGDEKLSETSTARRDFLKFLGFSVAAATVAACEAPVTKAIPYVIKPENVTPGMPTWYASTYYDGNSYASILVKTREGRPIYIKGNKDFGITKGATNPQIVASVLGLYEGERLQYPTSKGTKSSWEATDKSIAKELATIKAKNGKVVLVSNTIISPTTGEAIKALATSLGNTEVGGPFEHIQYDAVSYAGIRQANLASFGTAIIPDYDFSKAKTIVSVGADFLSTWLLATEYTSQYGMTRNPDNKWMSKHFQFESIMSVTGSNADYRGMIKPSEQANVLAYILKGFGVGTSVSTELKADVKKIADEAIKALKASKQESLVVAGSNNKAIQILVNKLNSVIGAYTTTINVNNPVNLFKSDDDKMNKLVSDVVAGKGPQAIIFLGTNPVYTLPNGKQFGEALSKVNLTVAISSHADETATVCKMIAPDHHALESWNDFSPKMNHYAIAQPTIRPLFDTASATESILVWAGLAKRGGKDSKVVYNEIQKLWEKYGFPMQSKYTAFHTYWSMAIHNSCVEMPAPIATAPTFNEASLSGLGSQLTKGNGVEVVLYQKAGIGTGNQANNPWLQEMPDPISKVTWDNYITMNPSEMKGYATTFDQENGLNLAKVKVGSNEVVLPVYPSPGQAPGTVGIALGYGRGANGEAIGKAAYTTQEYGGYTMENGKKVSIGQNVYQFVQKVNGSFAYEASASVTKEAGMYLIAATQIHHTVMARNSIVRETTLDIYTSKNRTAYNPKHTLTVLKNGKHEKIDMAEADLWDAHPVENIGHRWGMAIDLSSCIGCGTCMIACQAENNVPVVGKDEVRRGREMHWIRIDRYFASDEEIVPGTRKSDDIDFGKAEIPALNPKVVHMPMMCQHCNHASCETVCPVAATNHSNEGLNQMAYNRCIGTRYCANNCAYKVRRFNWFNYPSYKKFTEINPSQDDLGRMVLNPDVTVRTRGVMEKCSFCVQRIQAGKLDAKKEGRPVIDGDVTTACSDACPTNAITVGDWNDVNSIVRKSSEDDRAYQALEEVGVKPNIWYKVKVRNEKNDVLAAEQEEEETHEESAHACHGEKKSHH
ncbi:MAG: TAT-variant-translocated molybdopterin oxidoreductase [Flavobacteriia bacterium]|nr:TAT-variant-translocated molybdopterin oxidoreductase [Flavobacteriia bacterium]